MAQPKQWSKEVLKREELITQRKQRLQIQKPPKFPRGTPQFNFEINGQIIGFQHIPKCAGTSVKLMLMEAAGIDWRNTPVSDWGKPTRERKYTAAQLKTYLMRHKPRRDIEGNHIPCDIKFTVIRDPIERVKSIFTNRVLYHGKGRFINRDFNRFMNYFPRFADGDLIHHSRKYVHFLNNEPETWDRVFISSEVDKIAEWLSELSGKDIKPMRKQTGGSEHKDKIALTQDHINKIKDWHKEDYEFWWNKKVVPQAFE